MTLPAYSGGFAGRGDMESEVIGPGSGPVAPGGSLIPPGWNLGTSPAAAAWTFSADALWLQRNIGTDNYLGGTFHHFHQIDALASGDTNFSLAPGLRLQLTRRIDDQVSWQGIYYGLQNWSSGRTVFANPAAHVFAFSPYTQTDAIIGGFASSLGYTNGSRLQNAELNQVIERGPAGSWRWRTLMGLRYFQWNDHINLAGVDNFYPAYENLALRSDNYLIGGQFGLEFERDWDRLHLEVAAKAGLLANIMHLHESNLNSSGYLYGSPTGFFPFTASATRGGAAGVLDLSTTASYQVAQHFLLRAGYQMLFVPGIALAPAQMDGTVHQNSILLHGPMAGFELTW